jgi:hypothetical protein
MKKIKVDIVDGFYMKKDLDKKVVNVKSYLEFLKLIENSKEDVNIQLDI